MFRIATGLVAACVALTLLGAPVFGHGEEASTDPVDGANLRRPPEEIVVTLTEPPADNARMTVTDGCGDDVTGALSVSGNEIVARPTAAEPGRWRVEWAAISEVDGHATDDTFSFRVRGTKDCSDDSETPSPGTPSPAATDDEPPPAAAGEGDGSFPVVPVALGAAAVVGLAAAARFSGGR